LENDYYLFSWEVGVRALGKVHGNIVLGWRNAIAFDLFPSTKAYISIF